MPGTVHLGADELGLVRWSADLESRTLPASPFMLFGQMTTADPSRSPAGTESAWAYTHLPRGIDDDASADELARRVDATVEEFAPGFAGRVVHRHVQRPGDLRRHGAEPRRRGGQRRHGAAVPATGVPAGPGARARRDRGRQPVPRRLVRPPRRRGARRSAEPSPPARRCATTAGWASRAAAPSPPPSTCSTANNRRLARRPRVSAGSGLGQAGAVAGVVVGRVGAARRFHVGRARASSVEPLTSIAPERSASPHSRLSEVPAGECHGIVDHDDQFFLATRVFLADLGVARARSAASHVGRVRTAWGSRSGPAPGAAGGGRGPGRRLPIPTAPRRDGRVRVSAPPISIPSSGGPT